jgi:hypothetical protein
MQFSIVVHLAYDGRITDYSRLNKSGRKKSRELKLTTILQVNWNLPYYTLL